MTKLFYRANDGYAHDVDHDIDPGASDGDFEYAAEVAAADYHANHDGWESIWPLTITLHRTKDGPAIAHFKIEREYEPTFLATKEPA